MKISSDPLLGSSVQGFRDSTNIMLITYNISNTTYMYFQHQPAPTEIQLMFRIYNINTSSPPSLD